MALSLSRAIPDGMARAFTRTGAILLAVFVAYQFALVASLNTLLSAQLPPEATEGATPIGLTLPVPSAVAAAILVLSFLFSIGFFVVVARALARPRAELGAFPSRLYKRRMGRASLTLFVGGFLVAIATVVGLAFLFIPGIVIAACFLFFMFVVGVEDLGVVGSLKRSWALSRGNRLRLIALVLLSGLIGLVVGVVPTVLQLVGLPTVGDAVSVLLNAVLFIFLYGIIASAYLQVTGSEATADAL